MKKIDKYLLKLRLLNWIIEIFKADALTNFALNI